MPGGIQPPARSVTNTVEPSERVPAAHRSRGSWRATASTMSRLLDYVERHRHARVVPQSYTVGGYKLGKWVNTQRVFYSRGASSLTCSLAACRRDSRPSCLSVRRSCSRSALRTLLSHI